MIVRIFCIFFSIMAAQTYAEVPQSNAEERIVEDSQNNKDWMRPILYWAIETNNEEVVELLLNEGVALEGTQEQDANLDNEQTPHYTSVHHAAHRASDKILQLLIAYQRDNSAWKNQAVDEKVLELFRSYVNNGSNLTPLHSALKDGDYEGFQLLLEHGENMNWQGQAPTSLLTMAIAADDQRFLDLMLVHKYNAYAALQEVVNQNKVECVEHLLPFITYNKESVTILEDAVQKGCTDIAIQLISRKRIFSMHALGLAIDTENTDLTNFIVNFLGT
jgi:ankyrin repeat protein